MTMMAERPTRLRAQRPDTEPEPTPEEPTPAAEELEAVLTPRVMHILDDSGNPPISWNPGNQAEVEAAKTHFAKMKSAGHLAYRTTTDGGQAEQLDTFDPHAERIAFVPQLAGG